MALVRSLLIRMLAKTGETQRRRESQRTAEASFSLRFSAFLCVSAFIFISRLFNFGKQPDKQGSILLGASRHPHQGGRLCQSERRMNPAFRRWCQGAPDPPCVAGRLK